MSEELETLLVKAEGEMLSAPWIDYLMRDTDVVAARVWCRRLIDSSIVLARANHWFRISKKHIVSGGPMDVKSFEYIRQRNLSLFTSMLISTETSNQIVRELLASAAQSTKETSHPD